MLYASKTLLAKIESVYNTDPTPSGAANSILTVDCQITPYAGPVVSRNYDTATLGAKSQINTSPQVQLTFGVEVAGSGTAGTAPLYDPLLRACGFTPSNSASPAADTVYTPISSSWESVTLYYFVDGMRHKVTGARGNVSMSLARGEIPRFNFTFIGNYNTPTAASPSGVDVSGFVAPVPVTNTNTPTFTMGGSPLTDLKAESFSFDMGNNVVARNVINSAEVMITDRNVTGATSFEMVLPSTKDWFTDAVESHEAVTLQALQLVHGTTAGNIVTIDAPSVQMSSLAYQNSDGLLSANCNLVFTPGSSGNDEITITVA